MCIRDRYYGGGAYIGFLKTVNTTTLKTSTDPNFGAQGVVGLDYKFNNIPLNLSLDWKPELNFVTDINFEPAAIGLTARFTFGTVSYTHLDVYKRQGHHYTGRGSVPG